MGYDQTRWEVVGRVSRHNSEDDEKDDAAWDMLVSELRRVCEKPEYERVVVLYD
jgi:hypothetical protein